MKTKTDKDRQRQIKTASVFAVFICFSLSQSAFSAFKHTHLLRSEPKADTTLSVAPAAVRLWFSEPIQLAVSSVHVADSAGHPVTMAKLAAEPGANAPVVAAVQGNMTPGRYTVNWRVMARDGHVASGHFGFRVAAAAH